MFIGDPVLLPALRDIADNAGDRQRVQFIAADAVQVMDSLDASNTSCLDTVLHSDSEDARISSIRFMRNYNLHFALPKLLPLLSDGNVPLKVRICLAETLGWFRMSSGRDLIVDCISGMDLDSLEPEYASELRKTLARLR